MIVFHRFVEAIKSGDIKKILNKSEKKRKSVIIVCYFPLNTWHQRCEISKTQKFTVFFSNFVHKHIHHHEHTLTVYLELKDIYDDSPFFIRMFYNHHGEIPKITVEVAEIFE